MLHWSFRRRPLVPGRVASGNEDGVMDELAGIAADAAVGDPLAAAALVRATQSDVWRLCAALGDRESADDLTQETYLRAFAALHRFEGRSVGAHLAAQPSPAGSAPTPSAPAVGGA